MDRRLVSLTAAVALVAALVGVASPDAVEAGIGDSGQVQLNRFASASSASTPNPTPTPYPERLEITITANASIGGTEDPATCPAEVTLFFDRYGGDPTTMFGRAGLWANCTDFDHMAIDASGTFDGQTFVLADGRYTYSGTFDGQTAIITGGPQHETFVFPAPPPRTPPPTPTASPTSTVDETTTSGATIDKVRGDVELSSDGETWGPIGQDPLKIQQVIRTGPDSFATLHFIDGSSFRIKPNSEVRLLADGLSIYYGGTYLHLNKRGNTFFLNTYVTVAGVLGTTFATTVQADGTTRYELVEGRLSITATTTNQQVELTQGNAATITADGKIGVAPFDVAAMQADWQAVEDALDAPSPASPDATGAGLDLTVVGLGGALGILILVVAVALMVRARARSQGSHEPRQG